MNNLLLATIFFPLIGVALCAGLAPWGRTLVRQSALVVSLITLVLAAILLVQYSRAGNPSDFAGSQLSWLGERSPFNIEFSVGLDGLSIWMFGLAALLTRIRERVSSAAYIRRARSARPMLTRYAVRG